jgi:hypothetical protein
MPTAATVASHLARGLGVALGIWTCQALSGAGADMPWTTYEAEAMKTTGTVLGPRYVPNLVESESSGEECVRLTNSGEFVEFTAKAGANAMVVRYSLPDSADGDGTNTTLALFINGKQSRELPLTSHYSHLYGVYPFFNQPEKGKPRNFYDEVRVKGLAIAAGDVIRLQRVAADTEYCILDLVDLEDVPAALPAPDNSLSVVDFGGDPLGSADSTEALRRCIAAAQGQGKAVWVPAGDYKVTGEILLPSSVTIQGAGMWHTTFIGDAGLYGQASRRVRFKLRGSHIHLADFAVLGRLNYRNDSEPNDGIVGAGCSESTVSRIWLEHTKVGIWIYNGVNLTIEGCRFRDTIADGVNLCVGTSGTVIENCTARGTGDDCFAIWPAASDQGFVGREPKSGNNAIRRCTGQLPFLANGAAVYGGASNSVEDCLFTDITTGCGLLISTTFPTSDEKLGIDNNFSGTTRVTDCELVRCGGYDHDWAWRGSVQICMDRRSISGLVVNGLSIKDSFSSGITVVAPGSAKGNGTLSDAKLENVRIANSGIGSSPHHDLWIGKGALGGIDVVDSSIGDVLSESESFKIIIENR